MDIKEIKESLRKIKSERQADVKAFKEIAKQVAANGATPELRGSMDDLQKRVDAHDDAIADHECRLAACERAADMDDDSNEDNSDDAEPVQEEKAVRGVGRKSLPALPESMRDGDSYTDYARRNNYSYTKVATALVKNRSINGLEREMHDETRKHRISAPEGILAPFSLRDLNKDRYRQIFEQRDLTLTTGAGAVPIEWAPDIIEYLYNYLVFPKLGVTFWSGDHQYQIPRLSGVSTQQVVAEEGSATASNETLDYIRLVPRTCTGNVTVSRKMLMQGSVNMEQLIRKDLARTTAVKLEYEGFYGNPSTNTNENYGILTDPNNTNIFNFNNGTAGYPSWTQIVAMNAAVEQANVPVSEEVTHYLSSPLGKAVCEVTTKVVGGSSTYPVYLCNDGKTMHGWTFEKTSNIPVNVAVSGQGSTNSPLIFGSFDQLIFAQFGDGLDIIRDDLTQAAFGSVRLVSLFDYDFGIRHSLAFAYGLNVNVSGV